MPRIETDLAAANNAEWCAAVWRSHGLPVERNLGMWVTRSAVPPFYPNAVTVDRSADPAAQAAALIALAEGRAAFAVKDSFACLPLEASAFRPLFDAFWLWREAGSAGGDGAHQWRRLRTALEMDDWRAAWSQGDHALRDVLRPSLLADGRALVMAKVDAGGAVTGGCIGYDAAGVLGVTNAFGDADDAAAALRSASTTSRIVRYERGPDLEVALSQGFEVLGPLRVWALR